MQMEKRNSKIAVAHAWETGSWDDISISLFLLGSGGRCRAVLLSFLFLLHAFVYLLIVTVLFSVFSCGLIELAV